MKLKVYQKYAQNWTITKKKITKPIQFPPYSKVFKIQQVITPKIHIKTMTVDHILDLSNIALHWDAGPQRNKEDSKDSIVPIV